MYAGFLADVKIKGDKMKKSILSLSLISLIVGFTGCEIKKVESRSLAEQANDYKKEHRIVFYNGADMNRRIVFYNDTMENTY